MCLKLFPKNKRYILIVVGYFCYTMDIMLMKPFDSEGLDEIVEKREQNITLLIGGQQVM